MAHPGIEDCSIGKWLGSDIFQNTVLSSSGIGKLVISGDALQVFKEICAFYNLLPFS